MILNCRIGTPNFLTLTSYKDGPVMMEAEDSRPHILIERIIEMNERYQFREIHVNTEGDGEIVWEILAEKLGTEIVKKEETQ